jgi:post-segregation antitoxin (ccd killing protein)
MKNEKSVKKTLTIPSWLNDLAIENNINFSQTLQEALRKELADIINNRHVYPPYVR